MSKIEAKTFTTPILRLVAGSIFEAVTEDFDGNPLTIKTGKDKGKETQRFNFGVAVPKVPGKHWADSTAAFLTDVWNVGHTHMGQLAQRDDFSWKVVDGDSTKVNKKNRKPADNEGWPGHWIVFFSSSYPPATYNADGSAPVPAESIKKGHYVQIAGSVIGNDNQSNPGVYINHSMVAHSGFGPEIKTGPDPKAAGFGQGVQAPAGMSKAPVSGLPNTPPPPAAPLPGASAPPPAAPPPAAPAAAAPPATPVTPAPSFIAPPAANTAPPPPAAPAAPAAPPAKVMTAKANGATYESFIAGGWTDESMRANGYLQ
jgi:hypothetical protein